MGHTDYCSINAIRNFVFILADLPSLGEKEVLGALGRGPDGVRLATIADGLSQTVVVAEGGSKPTLYISGKRGRNPAEGVAAGMSVVRDSWGWAEINGVSVTMGLHGRGFPTSPKKTERSLAMVHV